MPRSAPFSAPSRRAFFKTAAVAASAAALTRSVHAALPTASPLRLGVASYSLRKLPVEAVIAAMQALQTPWICLKSFHLPYELSAAEITAACARYAAAGLTIVGGGTISFREDNDAAIRPYFEYAKAARMPVIVCSPLVAALPRLERFVQEYDIRIAIHNHGPEDQEYPTSGDALRHLAGRDPRMGVCLDIGHSARAGADIVAEAAASGPRLFDIHMKDLKDVTAKDSQCIVGEGVLPIAPLLRQLQRQGYAGCVNLEYEIESDDPLPGMLRSFAHLRGIVAGLSA